MSRRRFPNPGRLLVLPFLLAGLGLAAVPGATARPQAAQALEQLRAARADLDLDEFNDFLLQDRIEDEEGRVHLRLQQTYRGLKVWGGQAILHLDGRGGGSPMDDTLVRAIRLETTANLPLAEALEVARDRVSPRGPFTIPGRPDRTGRNRRRRRSATDWPTMSTWSWRTAATRPATWTSWWMPTPARC